MKYAVNMVRSLRAEEKKAKEREVRMLGIILLCFGLLTLSLFYSALETLSMNAKIGQEKNKLKRIEDEYKRYKATNMFVDKSDIELLDKIHNGRIFWTKKLASMAYHLPENYWIQNFEYDKKIFDVFGYGYITKNQEQLITLDDYLNLLRKDDMFSDIFKFIYLKSTDRKDEEKRERVSFEYAAAEKLGK